MTIECPMILDEYSRFRRRPVEQTYALKVNLLGDTAVLSKQLDRMRHGASDVRPARDIQTDFQRVASMPGFVRKLKRRTKLQLIGVSSPGIEKIASPTVRSNQHV